MKTLNIHFAHHTHTYPVYIGENICNTQLIAYCQTHKKRWIIITDTHLVNTLGQDLEYLLQSAKISTDLLCFSAGENNKTRETKQQLEDVLLQKNYGRDIGIIALGGGVVTDMVGFLAATYCRGVAVIYIPTTLLAMVDASIGGKTGINTPLGKNLIGAFYQPNAVFMDITLLHSLPEREWHNGIVEMLKHGLIDSPALFETLQKNTITINHAHLSSIIYKSCAIKQKIIEQDERDLGIRQMLNFGHTIGHAIETLSHYQCSHGEAVAIGMIVEAYLSVLSGFLDFSVVDIIEQTLRLYHLPLITSAFHDIVLFKKALGMDKKALVSIPHFVLLDNIGKTHQEKHQYVFTVTSEHLDQALMWAKVRFH